MDKKAIGIRTADIYLRFPEIMEEEANELAEFLEDEKIVYEGATDVVIDLQQKIDKAVEYIEMCKQKYDVDGSIEDLNEFSPLASPNYLLNILKGDDTNDN